MILATNNNKRNIIGAIALVLAAVPIVVIFFIVITSNKNSVVLFENYSPKVSIPIISFYFLLYLALFCFGIYWLVKQILFIIKLKNENGKMELLHLQNQVNPHFFFNMLNNLYGWVAKDQKKAQELILKLSDMMRYSIYEGQKNFVTIGEEVAYLKNYIDLHTLRYHKKINVNFETTVEDDQLKIIPLLYIMLLENAFKHGVENLRENAFVTIKLSSNNNTISFKVENNYDTDLVNQSSGIGIKNLKRRLELAYPKKHEFLVSKNNTTYKALLILKL
ncbi:sensor histidine kinase [Flavobacterium flavigenum]|uniref:sensor histidine kinase n=1 Tax=Flavobacterium flavigenum TaxID=3003258 RepID=UPI00248227D3|nr:histidine kinase [Flavobacterium flavigenum]